MAAAIDAPQKTVLGIVAIVVFVHIFAVFALEN
jgi:hypothetical protein